MLDQIYRHVPPEKRRQLEAFRASHPYQTLNVGEAVWQYIACGQGAQALLILGGGMATGESAFRTIARYEGSCRVLSPSYPPVGDMGRVVDGLAAILEAEGLRRVHVFGHSLGAAAAHIFVRRYPGQVDKLILSGFGLYTPGHTRLARLFLKLPASWLRAYYRRAAYRLTTKVEDPGERAFTRAYFQELMTAQHNQESLMAQLQMLLDVFDHPEAYGVFTPVNLTGRALILAAQDDRGFSQEERQKLFASYPGAKVHIFESGGHWVGLNRRAEYDAALDDFLGTA